MAHRHGFHGHHQHGGLHHHGGHRLHGGYRVHAGHLSGAPLTTAVIIGHPSAYAAYRPMNKCMVVFGAFLLMAALILLICGVFSFAGLISGDAHSRGIPLLAFGGILFIAGIMFTAISCIGLKASAAYDREQVTDEVSSSPAGQPMTNPLLHSSFPVSLPSSAPPPYSSESVQFDQASGPSAQRTYPGIGFVSTAHPGMGYAYPSYATPQS